MPANWSYSAGADPSAGRDERLDLLRGLCLLKMVLTHLWPQPVDLQIAFGFVSAAEGFFLLSGATTGIVFDRRAESSGFAAAARALARRGAQLYLWNLALVCIFFAAETTRLLPYDQFHRAEFTPAFLLRFNQPYFLQMLPRYALFLLLAPLALAALRSRRTALLVALSCGLWAAVALHGGRPRLPWVEEGGTGTFLIFAWQLPFFVGMTLGFHRDRLGRFWRRLPASVTLFLPALGFFGFVVLGIAHVDGTLTWEPARVAALFGRDQLGPGRLLNLACAALFFFAVVDRLWKPIRFATGWLLLPFGRHALYIFLAHVVTYGLGLAVGPRLPFALHGQPLRLVAAGLLHLGLLWALARWAPLRRRLAL